MFDKRPPCPGDYRDYVWVQSRERAHWRRKRGSHKPAPLNAGWQESCNTTKIVSPAAKIVRRAIAPYLRGLNSGRLNNRIGNAFRQSLEAGGQLQLRYLKGIEMQRDYPLDGLLQCNYRISVNEKSVRIEIPVGSRSMKAQNALVSDYYFEAVLLYGDVSKERGLDTISAESKLYSYYEERKQICVLNLPLPQEDWCLFLKISSLEGKELAVHTKHYRMKVVAACED